MGDGTLRSIIDEHWTRLEDAPASSRVRLRAADLPVESAHGRVAAAIDHEGRRHLLVPLANEQNVRRVIEGPALTLRRRELDGIGFHQAYADLTCVRADLNDVFTGLCADVLVATEAAPANPLKDLYGVLDRWRALLQTTGAVLGPEQAAGLFAELSVLERLLARDANGHLLWAGPYGHRHDFTSATRAVEVKASVGTEGRRVRVHGLDQFEPPANGALYLAYFRLERVSGGASLNDRVRQALGACDDEAGLLGLLARIGYRTTDAEAYREYGYRIVEERWYAVDAAFPKLVGHDLIAAGIPVTVTDVQYTIDLTSEPPLPAADTEINVHLDQMVQEER